VEEKEGILLLLLSAGLKRPCVCGILMLISSMFLLALPPSRFGTVVRSCGKALDGASCCLAYPFSNCDLELHLCSDQASFCVDTPRKSLHFSEGYCCSAFPGTRVDALVKLCTHFGLIYKCICTEQDRSIEICKLLYEVNALWLCELCEERICLTSFALEMLIMMVLAFG